MYHLTCYHIRSNSLNLTVDININFSINFSINFNIMAILIKGITLQHIATNCSPYYYFVMTNQ